VLNELPHGLPGLLIAAVMGSTMSVFSGGLNAAATSIYIDIIDHAMGRGVAPHQVVKVTRALTAGLALISVGLAFASAALPGLMHQSVSLMGLALGPLLGVNLLGMCTTTANWQGTLFGLWSGIAGALYVGASSIQCTGGVCPAAVWSVGRVTFFWYGAMLCAFTFVVGYLASIFFPPPSQKQLRGLCVWVSKTSKTSQQRRSSRRGSREETAKLLQPIDEGLEGGERPGHIQ